MRHLAWKHRGWLARRWDLVEGERVVATLTQRGWGRSAEVEHGARKLRVETTGILRWRMRILDSNGVERASMKLGWRGQGRPELADGRAFAWAAESWWATRWLLDEVGGGHVAHLEMGSFLKLEANVEVARDAALGEDDLVALLALTWAALVLAMQAATSAGGA